MLAASKDTLVAGLKQNALLLRHKELEYYVERYSNITTQAATALTTALTTTLTTAALTTTAFPAALTSSTHTATIASTTALSTALSTATLTANSIAAATLSGAGVHSGGLRVRLARRARDPEQRVREPRRGRLRLLHRRLEHHGPLALHCVRLLLRDRVWP